MYITSKLQGENAEELGMEKKDVEKLMKFANHVTQFNKKVEKTEAVKPADTTEKEESVDELDYDN